MIAAELGVAEGYHSAEMLANGVEKLYMVDAWTTLSGRGDGASPQEWHDMNMNAALARVEKYGDKAVILRGTTFEMAEKVPDNSLGLLYLDANHTYEGVTADLQQWFPKLVNGGVCAGHDYLSFQYGVWQAVHDFFKGKIHTIKETKDEDAGFWFIK